MCSFQYDGDLVSATLNRNAAGGMYRTREYKEYREVIGWLGKANYDGESRKDRLYAVHLDINLRDIKRRGHRRDIDNLTKPVLDALTKIIWDDDTQVTELHIKLEREAEVPGFTLVIYDIGYWHHYVRLALCPQCDKEFETPRYYKHAKFCSRPCMDAYRRLTNKCLECGKEFTYIRAIKYTKSNKFCCLPCYWVYMKKHPEEYKNVKENLSKAHTKGCVTG